MFLKPPHLVSPGTVRGPSVYPHPPAGHSARGQPLPSPQLAVLTALLKHKIPVVSPEGTATIWVVGQCQPARVLGVSQSVV